MTNWHRLFGLFIMDFFTASPFVVELEKDLSSKQQFLDVVIVRKQRKRAFDALPDGLDNLAEHNLLSYKSLREPFDGWALKELTGHYVNYRKLVSSGRKRLLPEERFRLYGVSTRYPRNLSREFHLTRLKPGVYEISWGTDRIRIIVLSEIVEGEHNAVWRLFSAKPQAVLEARQAYQTHQLEMSTIVQQLFENYQQEKFDMSYTVLDFQKDYVRDHLDLLSPEEVLKRFSPEEVLKRFSPEEVLKRFSPDDRLQGLSPDDIIKHLSAKDLEKLRAKLEKLQ
ncbi:MAG: hypothetical protein ACRER2_03080 [Methylococcales bacterium]